MIEIRVFAKWLKILLDSIVAERYSGNTINLFADDMLLFRIINDARDMELVQQGIDNVSDWVEDNNLCLNSTKCKFMIISKLRNRGVQNPMLTLHNNPLEQVTEYKYLGIIITSTLSWSIPISVLYQPRLVGSSGCIVPSFLSLVQPRGSP